MPEHQKGLKDRIHQALARRPGWVVAAALLLVYLLGALARAEDHGAWQAQPEVFSHQGHPVLLNGDGYYYLRLARDLAEGTYEGADPLRLAGEAPPRPAVPPLLSALTYSVHALSGASVEASAVWLPVFLGPLLVLPLFGLARGLGVGRAASTLTAAAGVLSPFMVDRSRLGFYDTDCLIPTLTLALAWLALRFGETQTSRRYLFVGGGLGVLCLFLGWWDQTPPVVLGIFGLSFAGAAATGYRPQRRELAWASGGGAVLLGMTWAVAGSDRLGAIVGQALGTLRYVARGSSGLFPGAAAATDELGTPSLWETMGLASGNGVVFGVAALGLVALLWTQRRRAAALAPLILLGLAALLLGLRFVLFLAPLLALGLGHAAARTHGWLAPRWPRAALPVTCLLVGLSLVLSGQRAVAGTRGPRVAAYLQAFTQLEAVTTKDAVVWTSWELGYPVAYYARRATLADGQAKEGVRLHALYAPLASADPRLSANFMQFYAAGGLPGLQRVQAAFDGDVAAALSFLRGVLAGGPEAQAALDAVVATRRGEAQGLRSEEDWRRLLFPTDGPPLYLLLSRERTRSAWWFTVGTWDPARGAGEVGIYKPFFQVRRQGERIEAEDAFTLNAVRGGRIKVSVDGEESTHAVTHLVTHDGQRVKEVTLRAGPEDLHFEWIAPARYGALMTSGLARSLFNRLFIRHSAPPRYFRHVTLHVPTYQVWQVGGDARPADRE